MVRRIVLLLILLMVAAPAFATASKDRLNSQLLTAVAAKKTALAQRLLHQGADPNARRTNGVTVLMVAAQTGNASLVQVLLADRADAKATVKSGETSLMAAVVSGNAEIVKLILAQHVDVNAKGSAGVTALMMAADSAVYAPVKLLLDSGADPKIVSDEHWTALHGVAAAMNRSRHASELAVARLLLDRGAPIDISADYGGTPLALAARRGDVPMVRLLLQHGANVNAQDEQYGETPLLQAVSSGSLETVKLLVSHGADVTARNGRGESALSLAVGAKQMAIAAALRRAGAIE